MPKKKKSVEPETVIEDGKRQFVTAKIDVRNFNGITMVKKDQRVRVVRDVGKFGVYIEHPLSFRGSVPDAWRLYNHELKGNGV